MAAFRSAGLVAALDRLPPTLDTLERLQKMRASMASGVVEVSLPHNWEPRPYQQKAWQYLENGGKRLNLAWHRRSGKDDLALHWTAVSSRRRIGNYWHMLPEANQARKAIWDAVNPKTGKRRIDEAFPLEIRASTREDVMMIRFIWGSSWQVVGSDNYDSLVGASPIGIVFSEWAIANPTSWAYLRPILLENGGWAAFIWTPRGRNHAVDMFEAHKDDPEWFTQRLTAHDTSVFTDAQLAQEQLEYVKDFGEEAGQSKYEQEYLCNFDSAILGAVYGKWLAKADAKGRITRVDPEPGVPVYTAWDLGYDDATAIWWFQILRGEIRWLDYFEANLQDTAFYCDVIKARRDRQNRPYNVDLPPNAGRHFVPPDAAHKLMAAGGRSIVEQAKSHGIQMIVVPTTSVENSINAFRVTLERSWFDSEKCAAGLNCLRQYQYSWKEDIKMFSRVPNHNWASHAADAGEIVGQVWRQLPPDPALKPIVGIEQMTLQQAFKMAGPKKVVDRRI